MDTIQNPHFDKLSYMDIQNLSGKTFEYFNVRYNSESLFVHLLSIVIRTVRSTNTRFYIDFLRDHRQVITMFKNISVPMKVCVISKRRKPDHTVKRIQVFIVLFFFFCP